MYMFLVSLALGATEVELLLVSEAPPGPRKASGLPGVAHGEAVAFGTGDRADAPKLSFGFLYLPPSIS